MKALLTVFAVIIFGFGTAVAETVIDDFQVGEYGLGREGITPPCITSATLLDPSGLHIIGGQRDVSLEKFTGSTTQPYVNAMPTVEYAGFLGISTYNSAFGCNAVWTMTYGLAGDLNADLTTGNADAFLVELVSGDMYSGPRPVPLEITVVSGAGTASVTQHMIIEGTYIYLFDEFTGVDFTDVDMLIFEVVQDSAINDAVDFALGEFRASISDPTGTDEATWSAIKALYK
jgi:hypothetical protein